MMHKLKAFSLHLILSILIAIGVIYLVFYIWYPAPLHSAVGVTHIFIILLCVDVALGPLLTLLVYKSGKKTLAFDLSVIAILQLSALLFGVWTTAEGRPVWLVYGADHFELVRALDIDERNTGSHSLYAQPSWFGPKWVGAAMPLDLQRSNEIIFESVSGGFDIYQRPNLYRPLIDMRDSIERNMHDLAELESYNKKEVIDAIILKNPTANSWLPLRANNQDMVVLMMKETSEVVNIVDLRPWN